ncbi:MAG: hypothetical protein KAT30_07800, partial [Candidatus Krumholzibacteria bacterium]|nr:hypothetical protein [Candidatus Krumholzibacteria bacterium]
CPTGIDIRRGIQLECVACTACIDACDQIMTKIERPKGLIRYSTEAEMAGERRRVLRPANLIYASVLAVLLVSFSVVVATRGAIDAKFIRAIETPYTRNTLDDGTTQIINHYKVKIKNQMFEEQEITLAIEGPAAEDVELVAPTYPLALAGGQTVQNHIFFKFPRRLTQRTGKRTIRMLVRATSQDGSETVVEEITLVGPFP